MLILLGILLKLIWFHVTIVSKRLVNDQGRGSVCLTLITIGLILAIHLLMIGRVGVFGDKVSRFA